MADQRMPLDDLLVLDLTRARAGPTAARQLADWGADVIKVEEPPEGAGEDGMGGRRHGFDFQNLHRNKRSIVLNLKVEAARQVFFDLARKADVVVENYRPDVKHRLGIDYESLRAINPRLIYGSISGFGQSGPYRDRPGVDQIAQGMGGLMSVTGLPGQGPVRVGIPIADLTAGMYLAIGILTALHERHRTGEGQWVHTSLLEAQIAMLDFQAARWTMAREVPPQAGNDHPTGIPTGVFPTADGHINIAAAGDRMFRRLCTAIGAPELVDHPDYRTADARSKNRAVLNKTLADYTRTAPSLEWVDILNQAGVPCGPIYSVDQTMEDVQVRHLGIAQKTRHSKLGEIEIVGHAVNMARSAGGRPGIRRPAPEAGEQTQEVLRWLGYDAQAIRRLRAAGAII